jgi:predicted transcriptional regulator
MTSPLPSCTFRPTDDPYRDPSAKDDEARVRRPADPPPPHPPAPRRTEAAATYERAQEENRFQGELKRTGYRRTVGAGAAAEKRDTYVRVSPEVEARAKGLAGLRGAKNGLTNDTLDDYLAAVEGRDAQQLDSSAKKPVGCSDNAWHLSNALRVTEVSALDVKQYLATGTLADTYDENGALIESGQDRLARLYNEATVKGSWPAQNAISYLVFARHAANAGEIEALRSRAAELPIGSAERADAEERISALKRLDRELLGEQRCVACMASKQRSETARTWVEKGEALEAQAKQAAAGGDKAKADELERRAAAINDRGTLLAHRERGYQKGMGFDTSLTTRVAARGQMNVGTRKVEAMAGADPASLPKDPPPELTDADGSQTSNGVPGAARILRLDDPKGKNVASDPQLLSLESRRLDSVASFHALHFTRPGPSGEPTVEVKTASQIDHREKYFDARLDKVGVLDRRIAMYGPADKMSADDALAAQSLEDERRKHLEEARAPIDRAGAESARADRLRTAVDAANNALPQADKAASQAGDQAKEANREEEQAKNDASAVFGNAFKQEYEEKRDDASVRDAATNRSVADEQKTNANYAVNQLRSARAAAASALEGVEAKLAEDMKDAGAAQRALAHHGMGPADEKSIPDVWKPNLAMGTISPRSLSLSLSSSAVTERADASAKQGTALLGRAESQLRENDARRVQIAGQRLGLASYYQRNTGASADALGPNGLDLDGQANLDAASKLTDQAEATAKGLAEGRFDTSRKDLDPRLKARIDDGDAQKALGDGVVRSRAALGDLYGAFDNGEANRQLAKAEEASSLPGVSRAQARRMIGSAAVGSLVRHDASFDNVLRTGRYDPDADDENYSRAHRLLDGDSSREATDTRARLGQIDKALDAVPNLFKAGRAQLEAGGRLAEAQIRGHGRTEQKVMGARIGTLAPTILKYGGGVLTMGAGIFGRGIDLKRDIAETADEGAERRTDFVKSDLSHPVQGSKDLEKAWSDSKGGDGKDEHRFRMLGALRVFADAANRDRNPAEYFQAYATIDKAADGKGSASADWQSFNLVGVRGYNYHAPTVAAALGGSMFGLDPALEHLRAGRPDLDAAAYASKTPVVTDDMQHAINAANNAKNRALDGATRDIAVVTSLEIAAQIFGMRLFAGASAPRGVAGTAETLNTLRAAGPAANGVRTAANVGRVAEAASVARGVGSTIASNLAVGGVVWGASWAAKKLFGANTEVAANLEFAANAAGMAYGARSAVGGEAAALERSVGGGTIRQSFGRAALAAHARYYLPQVGFGLGQHAIAQAAVPALADAAGLGKSEAGQAVAGIVVNAVLAGVVHGAVSVSEMRASAGRGPQAIELSDAQRARVDGVLASEAETITEVMEGPHGGSLGDRGSEGESFYERLGDRLETEAGLGKDAAAAVVKDVEQRAIANALVKRLGELQAQKGERPLTDAEIAAALIEVGKRAGLSEDARLRLARDAVDNRAALAELGIVRDPATGERARSLEARARRELAEQGVKLPSADAVRSRVAALAAAEPGVTAAEASEIADALYARNQAKDVAGSLRRPGATGRGSEPLPMQERRVLEARIERAISKEVAAARVERRAVSLRAIREDLSSSLAEVSSGREPQLSRELVVRAEKATMTSLCSERANAEVFGVDAVRRFAMKRMSPADQKRLIESYDNALAAAYEGAPSGTAPVSLAGQTWMEAPEVSWALRQVGLEPGMSAEAMQDAIQRMPADVRPIAQTVANAMHDPKAISKYVTELRREIGAELIRTGSLRVKDGLNVARPLGDVASRPAMMRVMAMRFRERGITDFTPVRAAFGLRDFVRHIAGREPLGATPSDRAQRRAAEQALGALVTERVRQDAAVGAGLVTEAEHGRFVAEQRAAIAEGVKNGTLPTDAAGRYENAFAPIDESNADERYRDPLEVPMRRLNKGRAENVGGEARPFFDPDLMRDQHGSDSHVVGMDFASTVAEGRAAGGARQLFDQISGPNGEETWDAFFDYTSQNDGFNRPETLQKVLGGMELSQAGVPGPEAKWLLPMNPSQEPVNVQAPRLMEVAASYGITDKVPQQAVAAGLKKYIQRFGPLVERGVMTREQYARGLRDLLGTFGADPSALRQRLPLPEDNVHVGAGEGRENPVNPEGGRRNCVACVGAMLRRNNSAFRGDERFYDASDVVREFGAVEPEDRNGNGVNEQEALSYLERASALTAKPQPVAFMDARAPEGNYAIVCGRYNPKAEHNEFHVIYGRIFKDSQGRTQRVIWDPQSATKLSWDQIRTKYGAARPYLFQ